MTYEVDVAGVSTTDLIRSLESNICPACTGKKSGRMSLCRECYSSLPRAQRNALYRLVGDGYEEAIAAAFESLRKTGFTLPPRGVRA